MISVAVFKVAFLTIAAFLWAWILTPGVLKLLKDFRLFKQIRDEKTAPIFSRLHKKKAGTPTMGGVLIWVTVLVFAVVFSYLPSLIPVPFFSNLNFLSRSQVLLPLGALVASAIVGAVDDILNVKRIGPFGGGMHMGHRLILYTIIALIGAWWFFGKLGWDVLHIPFMGDFTIGWWYIPFFLFVIIGTAFSVNEIDGLDGLAGGVLLSAFAAFGAIAFLQGKYDLATFCGVIIGALLAFLWFNIYPAKFFMGDTGSMSLGITLGIVAMLTNSALLLPINGLLLIVETR